MEKGRAKKKVEPFANPTVLTSGHRAFARLLTCGGNSARKSPCSLSVDFLGLLATVLHFRYNHKNTIRIEHAHVEYGPKRKPVLFTVGHSAIRVREVPFPR